MEGLFIEGHLGHGSNSLTNRMDRSRDQGTTPKDSRSSAENPSSSKPKLKEKMSAAPTHSDAQETEGYSRPRTWKDKPGMAKKRKSTKKRQYWEMVEVDDIDDESFEESALSVRDSTSRPKGKSKSKSENGSQRAPINYVISSDADSESESAVETDEEDYEERSKSARTKAKGKGRPKQNLKSPSAKAKKGKKHKNNKKEKKEDKDRAQSQEADIQGLSLSSMENTVYTIDGILSAEYKLSNATGKKSWLYTIKWHGYTIAQTAHEEPIPAEFFGDGEIIEEFWSGVGAKLDVYSTTKTEKGVPVLEPKGKTGERYVASPRSLVKWHIAAYRKYKEESLVFVRRLRRLEKRLENGARLDKKIVTVRGILKKGKEELRAHIADTKREIDINARAARANGEPFDLEEAMEDVSESDIATDYALGETVSTDDDEDYRQVSPARVPTKKRKAIAISLSDSEDLPLTVSRPAPNPASEVVQDTSSGIKLKLPVKASRLEEDRTPKERNLAPWPTKSSGQPKPKLPNSGNNQPSTSLVKEPTSNQDNSLPSASPRNPSERSANELRPKPRKRMKQLVEDSQRTSTGKISVRSLIEGRHPSPSRIQKVTPPTTASPHLEDTMPVTGPANEEQDFVPSASGPLFLDGPEAHAAADSNRRRISWAFGADTPSLDAVRIGRDRYGIPATVSATPNVSALSPPVRSGTQASSRAEDDRQLPSEAARDRSVDLNRPQTLPVGETVPFVKAEPHSPEHKYSGSEGEVEHDLGLDVELDYPGVPEPIVVRDDHRPRPPPETSGVTFHLRFDAPHIGKRTIGKVKLESISDPINLGDPLAMFESLFLGGERELVIDQAITDAGRFLGGQKVNQFARIRPENTESTKEINKLTLLFQNTRQPVSMPERATINRCIELTG
ncbi:hypothetical protein QFC19_009525 [Naganishia cerealis]|uniref:Uncharacterized protein n=1 Tax=Naganishia cerealis TaxID=610337 RepID=A0ACC2UUY5_9TREE|nr:hypothetical protein QFC19_009525 [Naganishia cerealis]